MNKKRILFLVINCAFLIQFLYVGNFISNKSMIGCTVSISTFELLLPIFEIIGLIILLLSDLIYVYYT